MSNKQSSIEWLEQMVDNMIMNGGDTDLLAVIEHIQQAKEMHKQEIIDAIDSFYHYNNWSKDLPTKGQQYYKETFVE